MVPDILEASLPQTDDFMFICKKCKSNLDLCAE